MSKTEMIENIIELLGGRVAEKLALDDKHRCPNDIERATSIARKMVTKFGMSDKLGPIMFGSEHDEIFIGKDFAQYRNFSENVAAQIDGEIKRIIEEAYKRCQSLIEENINKLHRIAEVLLEKEKLDADEFEEVFKVHRTERCI